MQVIALSLDRERRIWQQCIDQHNEKYSGVQAKVYNTPKSALIRFFTLRLIPHILLSKGGKTVLQAKMPPPTLRDQFEETLQKYL